MPASSGDPIGGALNRSLATSMKSSPFDDDTDTLGGKLAASAKRVLLAEVKYEKTSSYYASVAHLKSKYRVLRAPEANGLATKDIISRREVKPSAVCNGNALKESNNSYVRTTAPAKCEAKLPSPKTLLFPPDRVQLGWQSNLPIGSGMVNMGNTCYLNSTLQALFHVPAFVNWLLNDKAHREKCGAMNGMNNAECLVCAVQKTLRMSLDNSASSNAIRPHLVYSKLKLICKRLMHGHQEDAHEFLRYLLESMDRSYLRSLQAINLDSYSKETSALSQIFGGYLRTEVRCLECRHMSVTFQHFQDLLLDIRHASTTEEALDAYFGREQLGGGDGGGGDETAYKCDKCHRRVAATKQFFVEKPPNVLCVQLKRFGIMGGKNSKHIEVSQQVELTKYWVHGSGAPSARLQYRLVSLVSHIGPSTNCGHYTAIGRVSTGHLYLFDDSMVRPVSSHAISGNNTYILMYELTSPNPSLNGLPSESSKGNCTISSASQSQSSNGGNGSSSYAPDCTAVSSAENCSPSKERATQSPSPVMKMTGLHFTKKPGNLPSPSPATNGNRSGQAPAPAPANRNRKSLVPYTAESSDSESEPSASKSKTPVKNGSLKKNSNCARFSAFLSDTGEGVSSECASVVNGWRVTAAAASLPAPASANPQPPQNWNVVDSPNTKNGGIVHDRNGNGQICGTNGTAVRNGTNGTAVRNGANGTAIRNGANHSKANEDMKRYHNGADNGRMPNKMWNGYRNDDTRSFLQSNSHQGYGSHVSAWNGGRTQVDREADNDRKTYQKRTFSQAYDQDIDQGRVKQVKTNHHYHKNNGRDMFPRRNLFQEEENRKNFYDPRSNNRRNFYDYSRNYNRRRY